MNYFNQFLSLTFIFRSWKAKTLQNVNVNKNLGKKIIKNMLPTKVCMFYELSEAILLFGLRYLHLDLFQSLHSFPSLHVQFCLYVFKGKYCPQFWKTVSLIWDPRGEGTFILGGRGLGPHIKFGDKIWGKVPPSSPNKRKNVGSSVTTRRKSWEKIPILRSNLKFRRVFVTYIFGGKIWGSNKNFRDKFWGQAPPPKTS